MPIYEYRCQSCDHELEALQKLSEPELSDCPSCGQPKLKKLISAVGFRLKGSGWYETDFKSGGRKNVVETDSTPAKESQSTPTCDGAGGCGACATSAATTG
ncbi:MAG: zinc ribbon domain-containing protein [Candidatus Contendobacter sp.]|nr:zinc ribbon domain-containing protein [Candidatus Contendobacter sp.]